MEKSFIRKNYKKRFWIATSAMSMVPRTGPDKPVGPVRGPDNLVRIFFWKFEISAEALVSPSSKLKDSDFRIQKKTCYRFV